MAPMNKNKIIFCILLFIIITSTYAAAGVVDMWDEMYPEDERFLHGIIVSSNFINGFSIGAGYNLFTPLKLTDDFFLFLNMGLLFEYKIDHEYIIRNYYHISFYDFLSLGFSGILNYNNNLSFGISPDIAVQFPVIWPFFIGSIGLFYRYNFYNKSDLNKHEFGVTMTFYDLKLFKRLKN
jgi:hypothetical protein